MKSHTFSTLLSNTNKLRKRFGRRALLYFYFILLSFIFWLLNSLKEDYNTTINYPIVVTDIPNDKILTGKGSTSVSIELRGQGYSLMKLKLTAASHPIKLNLNKILIRETSDSLSNEYYIPARLLHNTILSQISREVTVTELPNDTLYFELEPKLIKKVPVTILYTLKTAQQFVLKNSPFTIPDSVVVSGPKSVLDTLVTLHTEHKDYPDLDKSVEEEIDLETNPLITTSRNKVVLFIQVEKFTEADIQVPIKIINLPDSLNINLFPANVTIKYQVGLSNYSRVNYNQFNAMVDYNTIKLQHPKKLKVSLTNQPNYIQVVDFRPKTIDYIIERY